MSYLTKYAGRRPTFGLVSGGRNRGARVDERVLLNLPGFHGGAYVRVFVEDTSAKRVKRGTPPEPRVRLRIADCDDEISLWFEVDSPQARRNSLHKIDTLLGALHRFRDALAAEADLYATRSSRKEEPSCRI
ncbi:MAG TPA: hypothetical protein VF587_09005 [Solirubrobacteraceae bacterium]|jgi:hypothetical protein